jgi:hypothetical protein
VTARKVLAARLLLEFLDIPRERHAFFVVVEKARDVRRRGAVRTQKLRFFVESRKPEFQDVLHDLWWIVCEAAILRSRLLSGELTTS